MPGTSCAKAIEVWQEFCRRSGKRDGYQGLAEDPDSPVEEATKVQLCGLAPPIEKMDESLHQLVNVKQLSLSTNAIEKMIPLAPLRNLEILSLGRNNIKKIEGLEAVSATLRELWLSYNQIDTLDGLQAERLNWVNKAGPPVWFNRLEVLFMSNNKIANWDELDKLTSMAELKNVLFVGNPIYEGLTRRQRLAFVILRLPTVTTVDGTLLASINIDLLRGLHPTHGAGPPVIFSEKGMKAMVDLFDMLDKNKTGMLYL